MKKKLTTLLMTWIVAIGPVQIAAGEAVIKSTRCKDLPMKVFRNFSGSTQSATVQIVRSTCRPGGGQFYANNGVTGYGLFFSDARERSTFALKFTVAPGNDVTIGFTPVNPGNVRGTFDYYITSE